VRGAPALRLLVVCRHQATVSNRADFTVRHSCRLLLSREYRLCVRNERLQWGREALRVRLGKRRPERICRKIAKQPPLPQRSSMTTSSDRIGIGCCGWHERLGRYVGGRARERRWCAAHIGAELGYDFHRGCTLRSDVLMAGPLVLTHAGTRDLMDCGNLRQENNRIT
jgi:hypothetical protein